jgi:ubiquinone/menaquinone biosynthesis C-methylase UbiE
MIRRAQQDHPSFATEVASLTHLPFADKSFDGYFSWYSTIHSPDDDLPRIFDEASRILRPDGMVLVAFQSGQGTLDVSGAYRRHGHDVTLERYRRTPDELAAALAIAGFREVSRLERQPATDREIDGQAVLIARR